MSEDYYNVLGVEKGSSREDIKKAYRKKAHQYHPDKENGNEEQFKKVNEAYQVLSDDQKKAQYDQFGQTFDGATSGAGPAGGNPFGGGFDVNFEDVGNIFDHIFNRGGGGRGQQVRRGQDVATDVTISFKESATGLKKEVSHRIYQTCSHCHGNQAEPGTPIEDCTTCKGKGSVESTQQTILGMFTQSQPCSTCRGTGKKIKTPCTQCNGEGRKIDNRTLEVEIPAGIADGQTIRLSDKGEAPSGGGVAGDLYITIHVKAEKGMRRQGNNVVSETEVTFADAALGTSINVATLDGIKRLNISAGTQPGTKFTISGQGFPSVNGPARGDHVVSVKVVIPKRLSREQKRILEEFKKSKKKGIFS